MLLTDKKILEEMGETKFHEAEKLISNLMNKLNYITYYQNVQLYLQFGLKFKKVHRVMQFKQKPWLKKYIDFNTEKRKVASSPFEKDFFKLMNNAVYGKTLENVRKRRDVVLVNTEVKVKKLAASPTFLDIKDFGENLVCIQRPIYTGFVVLELSKLLMYKFH